jgi:hypothetical protein
LAEPLQLQRIDLATVLQGADRVADRLAGVAVFTLVQNLVDEGVLFGRETDVAGGYGAPPDLQRDYPTLATVAKSSPHPCG